MKFSALMKKELRDLITIKSLAGMIAMAAFLTLIGYFMGQSAGDSISSAGTLYLHNLDGSEFTAEVLKKIDEAGEVKINEINAGSDDYALVFEEYPDIKSFVIIPENFSQTILNDKKPGEVKVVSKINLGGIFTSMDSVSAESAGAITSAASDRLLLGEYGMTEDDIALIQAPVSTDSYSVLNGNVANISGDTLIFLVLALSLIAPLAVYLLLVVASSMVITAISTEKIDKTLETLLSAPVSRMSVLAAKILSALTAALVQSLLMALGFVGMGVAMGGTMATRMNFGAAEIDASQITSEIGTGMAQAISDLGINLSGGSFLLLFLQLFLSVAIGLSIAMSLGAAATDAKSAQALTMPVAMGALIPFFLVMYVDINSLPVFMKAVLYAIPFTHSYTAATNLLTGDSLTYWAGFAYQALFLIASLWVTIRIFSTDKLFTMAYAPGKKRKKGGEQGE